MIYFLWYKKSKKNYYTFSVNVYVELNLLLFFWEHEKLFQVPFLGT